MDETDHQWQSWVRRLAAGDEDVVRSFWNQYGHRLQGLAAEFLASGLCRREAPEDVVQSVCRSFLMRARAGEFCFPDRDSLWRLLSAITLTKVREKARFHNRQKRRFDRERSLDDTRVGRGYVKSPEPGPAEAAEFADELQRLLAGLEPEEQQIVQLRLEQCTCAEIAERLHSTERTVRRLLKRVQCKLQDLLEQSSRGL
jgi:RNA polymerase sigma factor (sigma-70 family)